MSVAGAFVQGAGILFSWPVFGLMLVGVIIGSIFGAIPGLHGIMALALLLPFIWHMDPGTALVLLVSCSAVINTANTFPAVFFNVPGSPSAAATILDGYPLARKGQASRALAAAFTASVIGGLLGAIVLAVSIPILRPLVLMFASPERFMMVMLGLVMVGVLSGKNRTKGLLAGALGVLLSMVGMDPQKGIPRFVFGQTNILYGISLIPVVMGLFALPEVIDLALRGRIASEIKPGLEEPHGLMRGIKDTIHHWRIVLRSSIIGVLGGSIPGIGGTASAFYAYGFTVQSAKNKDDFGKGDIRGVIAPESCNNAVSGGMLIPTVAFGIPGSPTAAVLLGGFMILGVVPGERMLTEGLPLVFSMVWAICIANVFAAALCMLLINPLSKISNMRATLLIPFVLLFVFFGSYIAQTSVMDLMLTLIIGLLGYAMMRLDWPRAPLLIGFVLGGMAEKFFYISYGAWGLLFFTRPVTVIILLVVLAILVFPFARGKVKS